MAGPDDQNIPRATTPDPQEKADKAPLKPSARPPAPKPARALIGMTISDRYRIERLLGEGGMGAVYQAEHTLMRKRMAIKVLHPEMTRLPEVVQRFEHEAMAAAHIDHPNVVNATDFGKIEDGSFFLALEYVDGKLLREVIAQGPLELGRALHIARQIGSALHRAHALKIVHRDLKPENIMLVEREGDPDFVKVLDFGIAKVQIGELTAGDVDAAAPGRPVLTQAGMVYGTPEYMAPEQALGQPVDKRIDIYALGIILYEMITGVRPFEAESKVALLGMQVTAPVPKMSDKAPGIQVPPEIEALVNRCLAKEASERLADAKELVEAINVIMAQLATTGQIDTRYASAPGSGLITNPGLISGINPPMPDVASLREPPRSTLETVAKNRSWMIAAGAGTLAILILVLTIVLVSKPHDTTLEDGGIVEIEAAAPTAKTIDQRVDEGITEIKNGNIGSGQKILEDVEAIAPDRPDVHQWLYRAHVSLKNPRAAMREIGLYLKTIPADTDVTKDTELRVAVRDVALREQEANADADTKAAVDDAFNLLTKQMGELGWDDLYDIAYGQSGAQYEKARNRARALIRAGDRTKMSQALVVTIDLQGALDCRAKNLLDRAVEKGDSRTLNLLKTLQAPKMAGTPRHPVDLLGCLHADHSLDQAIAALDARLRKR